jgi:ankyrin repeat protein
MANKVISIFFAVLLVSCYNFLSLEGLKYENFDGTAFEEMAEAADDGDCERLRELMATGKYDINQVDSVWGANLLQIAVAHHEMDMIRCLLDLGADPNAASFNNGISASSVAVQDYGSYCDTTILSILYQYGMDVNFVERSHIDWDPSQPIGPRYALLRLSASGCLDISKYLVSKGADVDYFEEDPIETALNEAIIYRNFDFADYLLLDRKALYTSCDAQNLNLSGQNRNGCVSTMDLLNAIDCGDILIDCDRVEKLKKYILDHPEQARYVEVPKME